MKKILWLPFILSVAASAILVGANHLHPVQNQTNPSDYAFLHHSKLSLKQSIKRTTFYTLALDRWLAANRNHSIENRATNPSAHAHAKPSLRTKDFVSLTDNRKIAAPLQAQQDTRPLLIVLVSFHDEAIDHPDTRWHDLFFGSSNKSVRNYYLDASAKQFDLQPASESYGVANDGVVHVQLPYQHPDLARIEFNNQRITRDALKLTDSAVDYAALDKDLNGALSDRELILVTVIAGQEASYGDLQPGDKKVWAHHWHLDHLNESVVDGKWLANPEYSGSYTQQGEWHGDHMATAGIFAHELGHVLGLPDLYIAESSMEPTDELVMAHEEANANIPRAKSNAGYHSLMAYGTWTALDGEAPGSTPAGLDAWSRQKLGFAAPIVIEWTSEQPDLSWYELRERFLRNDNQVAKIIVPGQQRYLLLEWRALRGFDESLKSYATHEGVAMWVIKSEADEPELYLQSPGEEQPFWLRESSLPIRDSLIDL